MSRKPELPVDVCLKIDEALTASGKLYQAGNIEKAIEEGMVGWSLIPEPKAKWDYYPQSMSAHFLQSYAMLGDIESTKKWVEITAQMYDDPNHEDHYVLMLEGEAMYGLGDLDRAYYVFARIHEIYGRNGFAEDQIKYLKFFLKEQARRDG
ncbi:hypothetical protein [Pseudomonas schmalbachii]|uniref:Tetratricopeptide repeat protein n=1 Tax=Pseudomonas schmalbachii TaxID=2816993 RepID=A0ABS3TIX1_9PSED|nr:hypothetical protein [Pseudomonas schmalbachii]MBO3273616.1 hypothetical protein [Pseudomonas schmalbachii]